MLGSVFSNELSWATTLSVFLMVMRQLSGRLELLWSSSIVAYRYIRHVLLIGRCRTCTRTYR
ncbi:hypothetical protein Tcan_10315 [Toxocara canis]|uniref:Uncharacterized protein n=1 Tax=Toxocara canis TaxID=6265 RepID=A0A0B2VNH5_TOXCA|nr:hypothetical protein Tcan_10315 [Toxocara canis]